jgi:hypothetical protein
MAGFGHRADAPAVTRIELIPGGMKGGGASHAKSCPGDGTHFHERVDVTESGFRVWEDYDLGDASGCPNARREPRCRTEINYTYTLVAAACDARCDGVAAGATNTDAPFGPIPIRCVCPW